MHKININFDAKNKLMIGSDPEYAIVDSSGEVIPLPFIQYDLHVDPIEWDQSREARANKKYYHPVFLKDEQFKAIMDGVAIEFTLPPVSIKSPEIMFENINHGLQKADEFVNRFGFKICAKPALPYSFDKYFDPENELKRWCGIFGCDKDADAIDPDYDSPDLDVTKHKWRYFGGHIHISDFNCIIKDYPKPMIRLMAICVGNVCNALSPFREEEKLRTFKYGQPGRFRIQNYPDGNIGVEYRSPSNYWTTNLETTEEVFKWSNAAYELLNNPNTGLKVMKNYLTPTIKALQTSDQDLSKEILNDLGGSKITRF